MRQCAPWPCLAGGDSKAAARAAASVRRSSERSVVACEPDQAGDAGDELLRLHRLGQVHLEAGQQQRRRSSARACAVTATAGIVETLSSCRART